MKFKLPQIPEAEPTPVVQGLLVLVEKLIEHTQKMQEATGILKDDTLVNLNLYESSTHSHQKLQVGVLLLTLEKWLCLPLVSF